MNRSSGIIQIIISSVSVLEVALCGAEATLPVFPFVSHKGLFFDIHEDDGDDDRGTKMKISSKAMTM